MLFCVMGVLVVYGYCYVVVLFLWCWVQVKGLCLVELGIEQGNCVLFCSDDSFDEVQLVWLCE